MKKTITFLSAFLFCAAVAFAQQPDASGKTYYDKNKTKLKEIYQFKSTMKFDPSNPTDKGAASKVKQGPYFYYYESGKLKISGQYREDNKHGVWKYYDEAGTQTKTETYDNGKMLQ